MFNLNKTKEKQNQILKRKRSAERQVEVATKQERNHYSQKTADVSGMTSIKDPSSTRTSLERRKQPMMYSQITADASGVTSIKDLTSTRTSQVRRKQPMMYSQITADASGVTSIKDLTSTRTSQERRKQPIMYQALRKELVHFLNNNTQGSPTKEVVGPTPQRKRVTALPTKTKRDISLVIYTPMPLYCGGSAVAGSGVQKSKGRHFPPGKFKLKLTWISK
jgi:hypothetical protein